MDKRFDGIDNIISKLAGDNKEEHEKIFEQLISITNTIIKGQLRRLSDKVDIHGIKILNLEKAVFGHN